LEFIVKTTRQERKKKVIQIGKKEVKLSLCSDNMILYLNDLKNSTKSLLDIINIFHKVAGYKINVQKPVAFLYTNNEQTEKEHRKTIPFTIASKKIKYLGINLTKNVKDLYNENHRLLKTEIKGDYRRWKDLPFLWTGRIIFMKMQSPSKFQ
jgi:hypothetical protein